MGHEDDKENKKNGSYIALLLKITTEAGRQVYPSAEGEYGWAAVSIGGHAESKKNLWQPGDKFVYTLDLSNGAGVMTPGQPRFPVNRCWDSPSASRLR